jgi:hypothetical protein
VNWSGSSPATPLRTAAERGAFVSWAGHLCQLSGGTPLAHPISATRSPDAAWTVTRQPMLGVHPLRSLRPCLPPTRASLS